MLDFESDSDSGSVDELESFISQIENEMPTRKVCITLLCTQQSTSTLSGDETELLNKPKMKSDTTVMNLPEDVYMLNILCRTFMMFIYFHLLKVLLRIMSFLQTGHNYRVCRLWSEIQTRLIRERCVETMQRKANVPPELSMLIESELFHLCNKICSKLYQKKARSLVFNLKENETLRMQLLDDSNILTAKEFVRMSSQQLATQILSQKRIGNIIL